MIESLPASGLGPKNYREYFPSELLSQEDLEKHKPNPEWIKLLGIKDPNISQRAMHGLAHSARLTVLNSLLIPELEKELNKKEIEILPEQKAALELSEGTHDWGYRGDYEYIFGLESRHQKISADCNWLDYVFDSLQRRGIAVFQDVSRPEVIIRAAQINRVHDYRDKEKALKVLRDEFDPTLRNLPLELEIFKDLDAGLERLRVEGWLRENPFLKGVAGVVKRGLIDSSSEKSLLFRLHTPTFEATKRLLPFARQLYDISTKHPEYRIDQWKATVEVAQMLGAVKL